jgi:hypothetical protein
MAEMEAVYVDIFGLHLPTRTSLRVTENMERIVRRF